MSAVRGECESCGDVRDLYNDDGELLCIDCAEMKEHERQIDQRLQRDLAIAEAARNRRVKK